MNSVGARSIRASTARTWAGSVESRTSSSGKPAIRPKVGCSTSGQRLDPPIPSRTAWVKPSRRTSSWTRRRCSTCGQLVVDDVEPAEPACLVGARPEGGVLRPQPPDLARGRPLRERGAHRRVEVGGQRPRLAVQPAARPRRRGASPRRRAAWRTPPRRASRPRRAAARSPRSSRCRRARARPWCPAPRRTPSSRLGAQPARDRGRRRTSRAGSC